MFVCLIWDRSWRMDNLELLIPCLPQPLPTSPVLRLQYIISGLRGARDQTQDFVPVGQTLTHWATSLRYSLSEEASKAPLSFICKQLCYPSLSADLWRKQFWGKSIREHRLKATRWPCVLRSMAEAVTGSGAVATTLGVPGAAGTPLSFFGYQSSLLWWIPGP